MKQLISKATSQVLLLLGILTLLLTCVPLAVADTAATMSSPTPGTTLASSDWFEWNPGVPAENFDWYGIWVGTTAAKHDIADINVPSASTSVKIPGLPRDGGRVFVRLWSHVRGSNWIYNDYTYESCVCDVSAIPAAPSRGARVATASLGEPAANGSEMPASENAASLADPNTYVIGPLDVLQITVWKEPEMSMASVPVRPDGKISLPLLNDVRAAGLTTIQLNASLTALFQKFVQDPKVTTVVTAVNSKRVYILGEVGHPGPVAMLPDMNVLQALSLAGGLSQYANAKKIYVLRTELGTQRRIPFNYKKALKGSKAQPNIHLQPGDTIVVP
jgi:polysaccharide export outer membrane protein